MFTRIGRDEALGNVLRALTTTEAGSISAGGTRLLDYNNVVELAATVNTPFSARIRRAAEAKDIQHLWFDQSGQAAADNAQSETADVAEGTADRPDRFSNTLQILQKKVAVTDSMRRVARAGGSLTGNDPLGRETRLKLEWLMKDQENALMTGTENTGSPRRLRGVRNWIHADNRLDCGAVQITKDNVMDFINEAVALTVEAEAGAVPNALYVPAAFLRPLGLYAAANSRINYSPEDYARGKHVAGEAIDAVFTDFGIMEVVFTPHLTVARTSVAAATSEILFLYEEAITIMDLAGSGIEVEDRAKNGPAETKVITEEITLEVRYQMAHASAHNFYV